MGLQRTRSAQMAQPQIPLDCVENVQDVLTRFFWRVKANFWVVVSDLFDVQPLLGMLVNPLTHILCS